MYRQRYGIRNRRETECRCDHPVWTHKDLMKCIAVGCGCDQFKARKANKYGAIKTEIHGLKQLADSGYEGNVGAELLYLKRAGEIKEVEQHYPIEIMVDGHVFIKHKVDYRVTHNDGTIELVEAKGAETEGYRIIRKAIEMIYVPANPGTRYTVVKQRNTWNRWAA